MKSKWLICLALLVSLLCHSAWANAEDQKIVFAMEPNWPPMEFVDSTGQVVGFSVDFATAVAKEVGLKAEFVQVSWDDIFDGLNDKKYDAIISSMTITPERRESMDFTIPYYIVRQSLITSSKSNIKDINQLKGKRVGTQADTTGDKLVSKIPNAVSQPYEEIGEAFKALVNGEVDAVIIEDVVGAAYLADPAFAGHLKMASVINTPGAEELYGIAVRKNNLDMLITLNEGIKALKEKGLDQEIRNKWIK